MEGSLEARVKDWRVKIMGHGLVVIAVTATVGLAWLGATVTQPVGMFQHLVALALLGVTGWALLSYQGLVLSQHQSRNLEVTAKNAALHSQLLVEMTVKRLQSDADLRVKLAELEHESARAELREVSKQAIAATKAKAAETKSA